MNDLQQLAEWASTHPVTVASVAILAAVSVGIAVKYSRRDKASGGGQVGDGTVAQGSEEESNTETEQRRKFSVGTLAAVAAFIICTSVSLNTGYRFTGAAAPKGLGMTWEPERILACAGFESLMAMCVLGARERLAKHGTPGWYGTAVWAFAGLSAVPAWVEGDGLTSSTVVRIIVGSFGAALAAHSALGLELRHRTGDEAQTAMAQLARDLRERFMARMGLAHRNRSAQEIARDHALNKAVDLADRYNRLSDDAKQNRRGARLAKRLAKWQDRAGIATDEEQKRLYRVRVAQRHYATKLDITEADNIWHNGTPEDDGRAVEELEAQARHMEALAEEVEAAVLAQLGTSGTTVVTQIGTPLPGPRAERYEGADAVAAECIDAEGQDEQAEASKAAAAQSGTSPITVRVPQEHNGGQEHAKGGPQPLRDLKSYPTKRAALEALYEARIADTDPRPINAIAEQLVGVLAKAGITLHRATAHRYITEIRPQAHADQVEADEAHEAAEDGELVSA